MKINVQQVNTAPHILSQIALLEKYFIKVKTTRKVVVESWGENNPWLSKKLCFAAFWAAAFRGSFFGF